MSTWWIITHTNQFVRQRKTKAPTPTHSWHLLNRFRGPLAACAKEGRRTMTQWQKCVSTIWQTVLNNTATARGLFPAQSHGSDKAAFVRCDEKFPLVSVRERSPCLIRPWAQTKQEQQQHGTEQNICVGLHVQKERAVFCLVDFQKCHWSHLRPYAQTPLRIIGRDSVDGALPVLTSWHKGWPSVCRQSPHIVELAAHRTERTEWVSRFLLNPSLKKLSSVNQTSFILHLSNESITQFKVIDKTRSVENEANIGFGDYKWFTLTFIYTD